MWVAEYKIRFAVDAGDSFTVIRSRIYFQSSNSMVTHVYRSTLATVHLHRLVGVVSKCLVAQLSS